jgi:hypothetical protein
VDKENYLLELGRYIHLNPVRAKIVKRPEGYRWSSYREYLQGGRKQTMTDTDDTLYSFSKKRAIAVKKYQEFMSEEIPEASPLKESVGSLLGDETFRGKVIRHLKGIPDKTEIPEVKEMETKYRIKDVIKAVSRYYGVREEELLKRKKATERQRKIAIYFCKILSGKKNIEVGRTFGITLQAVTNALRDIERMREEDKKIEKEIEAIRKEMGE